MKHIDILVGPIGHLMTPRGFQALGGKKMDDIFKLKNAAIAVEGERIIDVGPWKKLKKLYKSRKSIEWPHGLVLPGFIDSHTHALFAASRSWEYALRLRGASYLDIASQGGGILNSCKDLQKTSKQKLTNNLKNVLSNMRSQGTTTVEIKSGYGLTLKSELKMLEVIKAHSKKSPMRLVSTFLGAHEFPEKYRSRRGEFVKLLTDNWLPAIAEKNLAEFCDVFCDVGVFTAKDSQKILKTAKQLGFKLKIHSDEFEAKGGTEVAAALGAISADHLGALTASGLKALSKSQTVATLLPGTCFTLDLKKWPPARKIIEKGVPVALATDCNPGSCMTESLPLIMSLACNRLKMTAQEALTAVTLNAAAALNRSQTLGTIEVGKFSDLSLWNCQELEEIPYHMNGNLCQGTLIGNELSLEK